MSETVVRVDLRAATLSESARLRETGEQAFLCLENPPPVRSLLRITSGEQQRVFEVGRVIEVVDESDAERGCHGIFVASERLADQLRVGSEHLQPQLNSSGVPSPVVIMNTNEMLLAEAGGDAGESMAAGRIDEQEAPSEAREGDSPEDDKREGDAADGDKPDGEPSDSDSKFDSN